MYTPFCFPCEFPMENGGESRRRSLLRAAEARLIASVPSCRAEDTVLPDGQHIHSLCLALDDEDPRALIMLGGYGLGAGMFCLVLDAFAKVRKNVPFGRVYALDWPGSGLCSPYEPLCDLADITLEQAIAFASDAMDGFLLAKGIAAPRVTLLGHSLGAYLAFCYCESRAARLPCAHLLLASCFGVPTLPAHRSPPWSEPEWLQKKASDLEQRKRARTLFDAGGPNSNRGIVRLVFGLLALCLPLLLLAGCIVRLSGKPNVKAKAARLASPVTTISARLGCAPLRWLLIRYVAAGVSVADFASYVFYKAGQRSGLGSFCMTGRRYHGTTYGGRGCRVHSDRRAWFLAPSGPKSRSAGRVRRSILSTVSRQRSAVTRLGTDHSRRVACRPSCAPPLLRASVPRSSLAYTTGSTAALSLTLLASFQRASMWRRVERCCDSQRAGTR
jgi:pimeloyl-ACP methyl ester carboxylesterase